MTMRVTLPLSRELDSPRGLSASSQRIHLAGLGEAPCKGHRVDAATFSPRFCCGKLRVDAPSCEWLAGIPARFPCNCEELRQTT
jgi:hypothetical protein